MSVDWRALSRAAGLPVVDGAIVIAFKDQRRQVVSVDEDDGGALRLWSVVARPAALVGLRTPSVDAWRRNRMSELVGFSVDPRGRMIGEAWVPSAGLTSEEWGFLVHALAVACDRFEYLLTGRDEA